MVTIFFYFLAVFSLLIGTAAIYMAFIPAFPVSWLYYHYFIRKYLVWAIFLFTIGYDYLIYKPGSFDFVLPLGVMAVGIVLAYRAHQERVFKAVDYPDCTSDTTNLPIPEDAEVALVQFNGRTKCYPLDYVIHHHIVNDRFNDKVVSITYCAMCRSIIPFDVTEIGPLFVASFKNANMIVADRKTKTFFQQASCQSVIGRRHPTELQMLPFQILKWRDIKKIDAKIEVVVVKESDFRAFELPIPGVWKKIVNSNSTPGLYSKKDTRMPARTRVVGIYDKNIAYLKSELLQCDIHHDKDSGVILVMVNDSVSVFKDTIDRVKIDLQMDGESGLVDRISGDRWNLIGDFVSGSQNQRLTKVPFSEEYWFSWMFFHPNTAVKRVPFSGLPKKRFFLL